ncbi:MULTISPECIES: aminotransferase class V-fold PLP-dependent enzyme [unclassified Microcoleus]|uniref:aminotransferase class V-fold PLP-dependent enzyme n=1 Tax=unclassified Microcoleus TaxID=2642155 RepID=UPI001D75DB8A|nr:MULTISPECIES: aminotransferase class V-fold PLP-dependent enzyme [unclassified Microcoleus]TAE15460.1 MAG: aminotransferase class V-fold PLP-dependent enzyme [Oscillatoriales cyanobacterium]MCC3410584.1 aminotransferase class V-fold PLP-dependent enzyme [Microcoleus sp. PH2017_02_FOX_O_A]MCC3448827.1 aminotransferase class V-fold PLP-dependent enzyme [Microcoleus sp. PH2017_09_SFU_O_A]MCC3489227.1 aminotransferase class V-fold PLP-dependent enzyme [Microcoleus sp. PH2017_16_JOR_D_A]MCC35159
MTKDKHRQQFPALANKAYFNYGGQGPLPETALEAIYEAYKRVQLGGPFSGEIGAWVAQEAMLTRRAIANELAVPPETIALTEDVTVGCNIALWGIDWHPGDHLLLSDGEHPGIVASVMELQRRFNLEVSICPLVATLNQGDAVAVIANYLQPNTRLLVISHILWNTGQVLPLTEIVKVCHEGYEPPLTPPCQGGGQEEFALISSGGQEELLATKKKVRVLVDAAQSVGVLPLNLIESGVDFYAFTGHKWWCGPEGLGGLYVSAEALADLQPVFIGWRGIVTDANAKPIGLKPGAQRYEIATSAYPLYAGLRSAIALQHEWGTIEERYAEICRLSKYLWERLSEISHVECLRTSAPEAGLVSFRLTNGMPHKKLVDLLEKQGIMVRTILNPDCVRACVHYFTTEAEIDKLVGEIAIQLV